MTLTETFKNTTNWLTEVSNITELTKEQSSFFCQNKIFGVLSVEIEMVVSKN